MKKKRQATRRTRTIHISKRRLLIDEAKDLKGLIYSSVIFILSMILFLSTNEPTLGALFGLIMILSGSLTILFFLLEIIFVIIEKRKR